MGKRGALILGCLLGILVVVSAAHAADNYNARFRVYTHNDRLFNFETWDANLIAHATFMSDPLREVFTEKHIDINHLDPLEADDYRRYAGDRQRAVWDFYLGMYTKKDFKTLTMDDTSFWKVRLVTEDGVVLRPIEIEHIPVHAYEKVMFPYLNRWSKLYRVTFAKENIGQDFVLLMASVVGEAKVRWRLDLDQKHRDIKRRDNSRKW